MLKNLANQGYWFKYHAFFTLLNLVLAAVFAVVLGGGWTSLALAAMFGVMAGCNYDASPKTVTPAPVRKEIVGRPPEVVLSVPATKAYEAFKSIPSEHRPHGEVRPMLEALDIKYGKDKATMAHQVLTPGSAYHGMVFSWNAGKEMPEYRALHDEFVKTKAALDKREHTLAIAERKHDLDAVAEVMSAFRDERIALENSTKALERM